MMPDDWQQQLEGFEAVLFGAVGWPEVVPDHISLWESLLKFRRDFFQYINLRPVRLLSGLLSPLDYKKTENIYFVVVLVHTLGEYNILELRMFISSHTEQEIDV